jgi:hypothetical protein
MNRSRSDIPTPEEFERASRLAEERARNLDRVSKSVRAHFRRRCPLHNFYILDQMDVDFRAYVFFEREADITAMRESGMDVQIMDFVYAELERWGRGRRDEIKVAFEFDSDERVQAARHGDYSLRLRE